MMQCSHSKRLEIGLGNFPGARFGVKYCHDNFPRSEKTGLECSKNAELECHARRG